MPCSVYDWNGRLSFLIHHLCLMFYHYLGVGWGVGGVGLRGEVSKQFVSSGQMCVARNLVNQQTPSTEDEEERVAQIV